MRRKAMLEISGGQCHDCSPKEWRDIPNVTGDFDLDATIMNRKNPSLAAKLAMHLTRRPAHPYGPLTAYHGYSGYHGDN